MHCTGSVGTGYECVLWARREFDLQVVRRLMAADGGERGVDRAVYYGWVRARCVGEYRGNVGDCCNMCCPYPGDYVVGIYARLGVVDSYPGECASYAWYAVDVL